jgi:hypothetical protein
MALPLSFINKNKTASQIAKTTGEPVRMQGGDINNQVQTDFRSGVGFGKELVGDSSLGRLGTNSDIRSVLEQKRKLAQGLSGAEMQAQTDVSNQNINAQTETARRQLAAAQARSGVRGATAGQQQSNIIAQGAENKANFQRDLLLRNRDAQTAGLNSLEQSASNTTQFDLSQAAKERFGQISTGLGIAQLGATERGSLAAAQALKQSGGGGGKK